MEAHSQPHSFHLRNTPRGDDQLRWEQNGITNSLTKEEEEKKNEIIKAKNRYKRIVESGKTKAACVVKKKQITTAENRNCALVGGHQP